MDIADITAANVARSVGGTVERDGRKVEKFLLRPKFKIETDPKATVVVTIKAYESEGTAYFDNVSGRLVEVISTQRLEVEAESIKRAAA